ARVEELPRGRSRETKRMPLVRFLDDLPMVGQARHLFDRARSPRMAVRHRRPVRLEAELAVAPGKAVDVVRSIEIGLAIDPALAFGRLDPAPAGAAQGPVDQLARGHVEARVTRTETPRERTDDVVIRATLAGRLDQLGPELDVLVAAALIDVVVL